MPSYCKKLCTKLPPFWLLSIFTGGTVVAQGFDSHVHGHAELNVVLAGQQIQIEFVSPAMNLLGFERAPNSPEETDLLVMVTIDLQTSEWLFGDALDDCQLATLNYEAPVFEEHAHEHEHEHEHEHDEEEQVAGADSHAEFHVQYRYDCPVSPATEYRVSAFERFSGIEEITVQWITERRQGLAELTAGNPLLTLE